MTPTRAPTVRSRGFTLLEALIAGAIFFIAVIGVSLLAVQGSTNASKGMRYAQAARLANQEMERWSMLGYTGIQTLTGGVLPYTDGGLSYEAVDGGSGRSYTTLVTIMDASGAAGVLPNGLPGPGLQTGAVTIPAYYISVQVTSLIPNSDAGVTVSQATYVSPN
jgi:type II secretory pathway pseudopilin PulG